MPGLLATTDVSPARRTASDCCSLNQHRRTASRRSHHPPQPLSGGFPWFGNALTFLVLMQLPEPPAFGIGSADFLMWVNDGLYRQVRLPMPCDSIGVSSDRLLELARDFRRGCTCPLPMNSGL